MGCVRRPLPVTPVTPLEPESHSGLSRPRTPDLGVGSAHIDLTSCTSSSPVRPGTVHIDLTGDSDVDDDTNEGGGDALPKAKRVKTEGLGVKTEDQKPAVKMEVKQSIALTPELELVKAWLGGHGLEGLFETICRPDFWGVERLNDLIDLQQGGLVRPAMDANGLYPHINLVQCRRLEKAIIEDLL
eukprot:7271590-Pyramimonas_sp.AAC.2